jgi:S-DNA-T family DNA segregation ATPase FtsK/SpoIIIE
MRSWFGAVFTGIISAVLFIIFACLLFGITPVYIISAAKRRIKTKQKPPKAKEKPVRVQPDEDEDEYGFDGGTDVIDVTPETPKAPEQKPKKRRKEVYDYEKDNIIPEDEPDELSKLLDDDEGVEQFVRKPAEIFLEDGILVEQPEKVKPEKTEQKTEKPEREEVIETVKTPVGQPVQKQAAPEPPKKPAPEYKFPPIKLLSLPEGKGSGISSEEAMINAKKIVDTLSNFGIAVSVETITRGPTITRYELRPAPGVRIARIGNLIDDLARVLASTGVRFESSIEGKDTVGIEVPNKTPYTVNIRSLIDTDTFRSASSKVFCSLGVSVSNEPTYLDIQKMPHLIIAGATGMGKSVCINSLIVSILYRAKPDEVKLIMIDPKKVEFAPYIGIPHLLVPVITDMKKAAGALNWLIQEMERRYGLFEAAGCRNIVGYNEAIKRDPGLEKIPLLVIIIDELAYLMATSKDSVELSISRIAAKARAAGMHLIIGTQRPDVTVISGTIKNNIPSRIA